MGLRPWTIKDLLRVTTDYLNKKQIESARLTAEVLLAHQINVDRVSLYLNLDQPLTEKEVSGYRSLIIRRLKREPLQYITGHQEFWSLDFMVVPHVLIPRPETELLVEHCITLARAITQSENHPPKILDLGTGCGAIAISLAKELQEAEFWATDISAQALNVARYNADKHRVSHRIKFRQGDLWNPLINQGTSFDIVLSNPPYIATEEYDDLPPEIRDYEPRIALDGQKGGMYYIEKIIMGGQDFINPGGWLMLEMGPDQTEKALRLMAQTKGYIEKARIKDYSHRYRVVCARKEGN